MAKYMKTETRIRPKLRAVSVGRDDKESHELRARDPFPIYRIWPGHIRSMRAFRSWDDFPIFDVPAVVPEDPSNLESRERACSLAQANALRRFLETTSSHCVVIEDDVTLINRDWLSYLEFDYFQPFANNRDETPGNDFSIRINALPKWGTQAYIASRRFASAYIPLLEAGGIADHVNLDASRGLRVGSFASNGVIHDNHAISMISEERRKAHLNRVSAANFNGVVISYSKPTKFVPMVKKTSIERLSS